MGTLLPHSTTAIYCLTHSIVLLYFAHMWSYIVSIFSIYFLSLLSHSLYCLTLMYPSIVSLYPQSITSIYCLTHFSNKIANDWIRTADLWCRKRPLYQLRHSHCFGFDLSYLYTVSLSLSFFFHEANVKKFSI